MVHRSQPASVSRDACNECDPVNVPIYHTFVATVMSQEDPSRPIWPSCPSQVRLVEPTHPNCAHHHACCDTLTLCRAGPPAFTHLPACQTATHWSPSARPRPGDSRPTAFVPLHCCPGRRSSTPVRMQVPSRCRWPCATRLDSSFPMRLATNARCSPTSTTTTGRCGSRRRPPTPANAAHNALQMVIPDL